MSAMRAAVRAMRASGPRRGMMWTAMRAHELVEVTRS
jgi:hypothetical protein